MAKDRNGSLPEEEEAATPAPSKRDRHRKSKRRKDESNSDDSDSTASGDDRRRKKKSKSSSRGGGSRRRSRDSGDDGSSSSDSESEESGEESESGGSESGSENEDEVRRRKRKERRRTRERGHEKERRRRKEKEKERKRKREREKEERKKKKDRKKKKEKKKDKKGAVTDSWGKYGVIRETDMWNKRPEFTAWLAEVKQVNLEALANWEEKQMFKEFMEDHNTATFPSKKYYDLDAYHRRKLEKEVKKGFKKLPEAERTIFNDEEQRRQELLRERERQKEEHVEALKLSMQSGMAQAMKEQARLKEEMNYQYRLGNFEAAAAIQRRLDPDVAM